MSLGGRPPEEGGHKAKNLSLDVPTWRILSIVKTNYGRESTFVERAIKELAVQPSFSAWFLASAL